MIDVARRFYAPDVLKSLIIDCELAKVPYMQLHLTDDQNWMFPTNLVPGVDKNNDSHRPAYTVAEIKGLVAFGKRHHVTLYPEIDLPGHSSLLCQYKPSLFRISGSQSTNCINFANPKVISLCQKILDEAADLFPDSPYIHIGGDEAWYPDAAKDPYVAAAMKKLGQNSTAGDVFITFVEAMAKEVIRNGKTPLIWEGFRPSAFAQAHIPKKAWIVAWDGLYYSPMQLIKDGYNVVNAGWVPFYVVNHYPFDSNTLVPLPLLYQHNPYEFATYGRAGQGSGLVQLPNSSQFKGCLLCWWEGRSWNALTTLPIRIMAFGAGCLGQSSSVPYAQFLATARRQLAAAHPGLDVRVSGTLTQNPSEFSDEATVLLPKSTKGAEFRYSLDGSIPPKMIAPSSNRITVKASAVVVVQAFKNGRAVSPPWVQALHRAAVVKSLAYLKPVSVTGVADPQFDASLLTDGVGDDLPASWLAYPCPASATIDLGSVQSVAQVQVVIPWVHGGKARFKIEASPDGKDYVTVADESAGIGPVTADGFTLKFSPVQARYIRFVALGADGFSNRTMQVEDIRVFGPDSGS